MNDLFTNGLHYPKDDQVEGTCGALPAHRLYFKDRDKPLVNKSKSLFEIKSKSFATNQSSDSTLLVLFDVI